MCKNAARCKKYIKTNKICSALHLCTRLVGELGKEAFKYSLLQVNPPLIEKISLFTYVKKFFLEKKSQSLCGLTILVDHF